MSFPAKEAKKAETLPTHLGLVEWFRPGEFARVENVLALMKKIGIRSLRTGVSWADWYTADGTAWYEWLIPRLAAEVEILPCFLYTPPSIGIEPKTSSPPVRSKDYADFLDLFTSRFGRHYEWVELWNEPNNLSEWDWTLDPHWTKFGEMIGGAAYWMKQRGKKTILGGMSPVDGHWLCRMFELGVMDYVDVVGIHGFPDIFDYTWKGWGKNIEMVQEVLNSKGSGCQIWVTEAGFSTWQHDELKQMGVFLDFLQAPAERIYWYGVDDLDPALAAVNRFHLDEREYFFGLRKSDGAPKLLCRLMEDGGLPAVRRIAEGFPAPVAYPGEKGKGILITGGAGFIGTNLADRLLAAGERVIIYDNLSRMGVEKNLLWLREKYGDRLEVRIADIRNTLSLEQAVAEAKNVFHFSAQVAVTTSVENPAADFTINAAGAFALLEAIRKAPSPPTLLFTSTNKVYGAMDGVKLLKRSQRYEPVDAALQSFGMGEDAPLNFLSPYGCSKGCVDQYVLDYAHTYGIQAAVFRMSCIYGPHQFGTEDQGWVAHFAIRTLCNQPISLYGDGRQVRDLLFVEDLVDAFLLARQLMPRISGQAFNIGGGPERSASLLELLQLLQEIHGDLPSISFGDWRTGDQRYYISDIRKFSRISGWKPRHSVEDGVKKLYEWLAASLKTGRRTTSRDFPTPPIYPSAAAEAMT
ncbi:NAD-dependent epimerase/dehydratase family protein [Geotalea sp. SG265]|uniref:NAD-dependent epimerase/dehydratase family protein n=1 Tax=Geotalea sp. SG265 TaxID=2922867 RepID=UPI001FB01904|nr:NAD-dependent epimerase/dehydratase family protein [Geotalea sp. SG265]